MPICRGRPSIRVKPTRHPACTAWEPRFYFLLAGRPLFSGETLMARLLAHRENEAPSLRAVRPEIPPQIDAIYQRMVAKKKESRYPSMTN
jgi:hypothetical protein